MLQVDIESTQIETRNKKAGGTYDIQYGFVHLVGRDGQPKRYPTEVSLFPPRDQQGNTIAYQKGKYTVSDTSFKVDNGFLTIAFINLSIIK